MFHNQKDLQKNMHKGRIDKYRVCI